MVKKERGDMEGAEADFQLHRDALARIAEAESETEQIGDGTTETTSTTENTGN